MMTYQWLIMEGIISNNTFGNMMADDDEDGEEDEDVSICVSVYACKYNNTS